MPSDKKIFILRSEDIRINAIDFLNVLPINELLYEVVVQEHNEDRSILQNNLMHMWFDDISRHTGETKLEVKFRLKKDYLVPIYERDNPEYAKMIETLRKLFRDGYSQDATYLHERVVEMTSTAKGNVKQITEFLNDIEHECISKKIPLRHPDDYHRAMGI